MPKSGQSRRKRMAHSKKKAGKGVQPVAVAQQVVASTQVAAHPQTPAPTAAVRTQKAGAVAPPISVGRELRRIGILTAIILVILVVLVRILT
jgi:hypothetical protein